ncbi:putative oxidoreductase [Planctomycetes bacterium Poly30]|uniref:Putative oxidoreductase n=1 Tax=Saltatorellus ferox TaxID=2528018 RepID=A0A518EUU2_9BACT|nr:putative oxidoreductase [Planctomycetes bacterium Poly30]
MTATPHPKVTPSAGIGQGASPTRRTILRTAAAATSSLFMAPFVHARRRQAGGTGTAPIRSSLKLAAIGAGHRGAANIAGVLGEDVAYLCDVDEWMLQRGVDQVRAAGQPKPATFRDWRELLETAEDLQGVVISTPDHTHAAIARWALHRRLPVYCEKPLTRTVAEAAELQNLAQGIPTQMGTQIHATDNYRRVVEALRSGAIGTVRNVHVVCSKSWSGGVFQPPPEGETGSPKGLDWDLWLGPTPERPYSPGIHPANWRRFWAFGNGTVGDMAAHWLDLVHWALELGPPKTIDVEGPPVDEVSTPPWMHARWTHGRTNGEDDVDVHWWDGIPSRDGVKKWAEAPLDDCHVFVGSKGRLISTYSSMKVELSSGDPWEAPEPTILPSPGHHVEWLDRIKDENAPLPLCHFERAAPLTESILLAGVAYRAGGKITWDPVKRDAGPGTHWLSAEERDGWRPS